MGGSPAKVVKKVISTPVKILSSPLGKRRPEVQQRQIGRAERDVQYKTDPKTKKVARKLMPRPGSKRIARSRRGGLLAGEFRRTLGSTRNPRHTNLGSESQLA
jgi:hypothetical protein